MLHWFARRLNELHKVKREERGFTLIELLVVVIIIGILAAIAIPVFLAQRENAWEAAAKSDLRNLTQAVIAWSGDNNGSYAVPTGVVDSTHVLQTDYGFKPSANVTSNIVSSSAANYTATSKHANADQVFTFNSNTGRITP